MPVTLQFVSDVSLSDTFIEWYGHDAFSHVDYVLPDNTLLGSRLPNGVAIRQPNYEVFTRVLRVTVPCTDIVAASFDALAKSQIGKGYDTTAIMGFVFGRNWREPDTWTCTEYLAWVSEGSLLFPEMLVTPTNRIDPQDYLLALSVLTEVKLT
jgi:hypothetical protein